MSAARDQPLVIYRQTKCPRCGSKSCRVYSTSRPIRYHACQRCSKTFRSIEEDAVRRAATKKPPPQDAPEVVVEKREKF